MRLLTLLNRTSNYPARNFLFLINLVVISIFLQGCASFIGFPTYYDPTTYKNLTDLKPKVIALYDTFTNDPVDNLTISAIRLNLDQIYEYEKGKGKNNAETAKQISLIKDMFESAVKDRLTEGKWSSDHLKNKKENIMDAFDIAIQTENLKNKNQ